MKLIKVVVDIIQKWWNFAPSSNIDGLLRLRTTIGGHSISYNIEPIITMIDDFFHGVL